MDVLANAPDSILVSAETVQDYQLHLGDVLNLRLPNAAGQSTTTVAFHYAGVVAEFPTAPKDSFFVANAGYVAAMTGSDTVGSFLVDTGGSDAATVAQRLRSLVGPSATVTDIGHTRARVGSSLTAVDLTGLTTVELAFALVLAGGAGGLVLFLGLIERRRSFAVISALGATPRQLLALVGAEAAVLAVGGLVAGAGVGWLLAAVLVAVLTGVFDPPPDVVTVPWPYLALVAMLAVVALAAASVAAFRRGRGSLAATLRGL
jgi:putative ABC transport system permease protein